MQKKHQMGGKILGKMAENTVSAKFLTGECGEKSEKMLAFCDGIAIDA
jgi:hypothetical protein